MTNTSRAAWTMNAGDNEVNWTDTRRGIIVANENVNVSCNGVIDSKWSQRISI